MTILKLILLFFVLFEILFHYFQICSSDNESFSYLVTPFLELVSNSFLIIIYLNE